MTLCLGFAMSVLRPQSTNKQKILGLRPQLFAGAVS